MGARLNGRVHEMRELRLKLSQHRAAIRAAVFDRERMAVLREQHTALRAEFARVHAPPEEPPTAPRQRGPGRPGPLATSGEPLTHREREVAYLVAEGLKNRQIARRLYLAEGTVANHIRRILLKLGFPSRARLAAWVAEDGRRSADSRSA